MPNIIADLYSVRLVGPESLVINDEVVQISDLVDNYKKRLPEGKVLEAKFTLDVRLGHNPSEEDQVKLKEAVSSYLERFNDYIVREISLPSSITINKLHLENGLILEQTLRLRSIWSRKNWDDTLLNKTLKEVIPKLQEYKDTDGRTLFDLMDHLKLVYFAGQDPEDPGSWPEDADAWQVIHFGCCNDCEPMFNFCNDPREYQVFVDHFESYGFIPRARICTIDEVPEVRWTSSSRYRTGNVTKTGWSCH